MCKCVQTGEKLNAGKKNITLLRCEGILPESWNSLSPFENSVTAVLLTDHLYPMIKHLYMHGLSGILRDLFITL